MASTYVRQINPFIAARATPGSRQTMASFRQQMQELADKIKLSRHERQQSVAQFPKMREQLRRQVIRLRDDTRRDQQRQADTQARQLQNFNTQNKKAVGRLLRDTRSKRLSRAQTLRSQMQREVAKNRSEILRSLQQHGIQRSRMQRSTSRQSLQAIQGVKARVESLRTSTRRMTRNLANDRQEARKIWASLQLHPSSPRYSQPSTPSSIQPNSVRSPSKPASVSTASSAMALAGVSAGELTRLVAPPVSL